MPVRPVAGGRANRRAERGPEIDALQVDAGEAGRGDADDFVLAFSQGHFAANDRRIAAEVGLPE